jgi:hypothetical protein
VSITGPESTELIGVCEQCRILRDAFLQAVCHVMAMNERHALSVMENEPEPHRFDLLIHAANEHKQNAKYAYMVHRETHEETKTEEAGAQR